MSDLLPKIKELLEWLGMGPAAFADEVGVARPVMSHILSERNKVSLEVVQKILARFTDVDPAWLLLGQGEMLKKIVAQPIPGSPATDAQKEVPEVEQESVTPGKVQNSKKASSPVVSKSGNQKKELIKVLLVYSDGTYKELLPEEM
ncbi:helix-turn-helix transcriptional regulator [Rufibacter sp. LB8]|uniref:helix-turn-helix domain-containing protein n=1 Tax=Rufibacter sp. LB8 TaxID=2777781 RepID=UPI00178C1AFF|nr:helix-turn-helix transcriptional regulator [Rufibacter sp. LB8]